VIEVPRGKNLVRRGVALEYLSLFNPQGSVDKTYEKGWGVQKSLTTNHLRRGKGEGKNLGRKLDREGVEKKAGGIRRIIEHIFVTG